MAIVESRRATCWSLLCCLSNDYYAKNHLNSLYLLRPESLFANILFKTNMLSIRKKEI